MEYEIRTDEKKREDAAFLAKWYGYLFWLLIPTMIGNILSHETVVEWFPVLQKPGELIGVVCGLIWAVILLKMKDYSDKLNFAGWGMLGLSAFGLLEGLLLSRLGIAVLSGLAATVISLVVEYHEYYGHSEVLSDYDMELAQKWKNLWKWEIYALGGLVATIVLAALIPILGLLAVLVSAVALGVVAILKWVYVYQTKRFFEEYEINEKYKDIPSIVEADYIPTMVNKEEGAENE